MATHFQDGGCLWEGGNGIWEEYIKENYMFCTVGSFIVITCYVRWGPTRWLPVLYQGSKHSTSTWISLRNEFKQRKLTIHRHTLFYFTSLYYASKVLYCSEIEGKSPHRQKRLWFTLLWLLLCYGGLEWNLQYLWDMSVWITRISKRGLRASFISPPSHRPVSLWASEGTLHSYFSAIL